TPCALIAEQLLILEIRRGWRPNVFDRTGMRVRIPFRSTRLKIDHRQRVRRLQSVLVVSNFANARDRLEPVLPPPSLQRRRGIVEGGRAPRWSRPTLSWVMANHPPQRRDDKRALPHARRQNRPARHGR